MRTRFLFFERHFHRVFNAHILLSVLLCTVSDKTLKKEALEKYLDGGFKPEAVAKQVTNGKGAMPAFGNRLSDDEIALVAEYVISTSEAGWE